jgi:hypothetical protein
MVPQTREEFKAYCLRRLGQPVIQINIDDDQVEDRIDEALKYYQEYHYNSFEKYYFKYQIEEKNFPDAIYEVSIIASGNGYANGESLVFTSNGGGSGAIGTISTNGNGAITSVTLTNHGTSYPLAPTISVNTVAGTGASLSCELGGFIELPDSIIGVVKIFDISSSIVSQDMFSLQYQIALNDIWALNSFSMIPYYTTIMHLNLIQQLLIGQQPIRYQRHRNRLHIDMNYNRLESGRWVIAETYQAISPTDFPDIWSDFWLQRYTTALIKRQWGEHLKKFGNTMLPGGVVLNGKEKFDEAQREIEMLEANIVNNFSIPDQIWMG